MYYRLEVFPKPTCADPHGEGVLKQIRNFLHLPVENIRTRTVYSLQVDCDKTKADEIVKAFANPVIEEGRVGESQPSAPCDWLIVIGFRPGVTDNVARSAAVAIADIVGRPLHAAESIYTSMEYLIKGKSLTRQDVQHIATDLLANSLIQTTSIFTIAEVAQNGIPPNCPQVTDKSAPEVQTVDLQVSDDELLRISRKGILALTLPEMQVIKDYFRQACKDRQEIGLSDNPTDVELEVLAQTWSEHCKHKIFNARIEYLDEDGNTEWIDSCFKTFIRRSTAEIAEKVDWLVSVFHDNAGVIGFNDDVNLVYKVETHNSPTALDPYGGAITGIVGVNRDPLGTGKGADLLHNVWGYCFASPFHAADEVPKGLFHPRRLRDQVHKGVIDGGNQSGIPYMVGWEYFDERYLGKPLVYCGTVGTLPLTIHNEPTHEKQILPGDLVVMTGGRIGKDGIHGATFSSEELHQDSPVQAVQIGDPITQKLMSDFLLEARDHNLYRFITDNGAGGLSSSIGEMAEICGGCELDLARAPLKYEGLQPWEILVSEAQERMSLAVAPEKIEAFLALAKRRDVEATVLGQFTDTGKFHMKYNGRTIAYMDIAFMHDGLPQIEARAKWRPPVHEEPAIPDQLDLEKNLLRLLSSLNICSNEFKARQYDHEVKGLSVIKPYVGANNNVQSDATVSMVEPSGRDGVILAYGIAPRYSDIDTYHMMSSVIDMAVRRSIAVGGRLGHIAGLDNFCWPDPIAGPANPDGEYKLAQLVRANKALYDFTKAFGVPCISGKDSMKNDSTLGGRKISIPPTVLFSTIARMDDISKAVTLDAKRSGDLVYVIGLTYAELGGSEFYNLLGAVGNAVPRVRTGQALQIYEAVSSATAKELCHSLHNPTYGGLAVGLAKVAIGGRLGIEVDISSIPCAAKMRAHEKLFSESNSRFIATVSPSAKDEFEKLLGSISYARIGLVTLEPVLILKDGNEELLRLSVNELTDAYVKPLDNL